MSRVRPSFSQAFLNRLRSWSRLSFIRTLTRIKHSPRFSSPDTSAIITPPPRPGNRILDCYHSCVAETVTPTNIRSPAGQRPFRELYFVTDNHPRGKIDRSTRREREYEEQRRQSLRSPQVRVPRPRSRRRAG